MNKEKMTDKRAGEIALAIMRYESRRKHININPNDGQEWFRIEKQTGILADKLKEYIMKVILPAGLSEHFGCSIQLNINKPTTLGTLTDTDLHEISLAILRLKGVDLGPDTTRRLKRMEEFTQIHMNELREFYIQYIIPDVLIRIMDWQDIIITEN